MIIGILMAFLFIGSAADPGREANEAFRNAEYATAEELYRIAIEESPDNAKLYFNLGNTLAALGKSEDAIQMFVKFQSMATSPQEKALAEYNIGQVLGKNEQWEQAAKHFKRSLMLHPSDSDSRNNYELSLRKMKENEEDENQQQDQQNQPPPEPSAYARELKKQAEEMVAQRRYSDAYSLMQDGLKVDETVAAYNDFIQRIGEIIGIIDN